MNMTNTEIQSDPQAFMDGFDAFVAQEAMAACEALRLPVGFALGLIGVPRPLSQFSSDWDCVNYSRQLDAIQEAQGYESPTAPLRYVEGAHAARHALNSLRSQYV